MDERVSKSALRERRLAVAWAIPPRGGLQRWSNSGQLMKVSVATIVV